MSQLQQNVLEEDEDFYLATHSKIVEPPVVANSANSENQGEQLNFLFIESFTIIYS